MPSFLTKMINSFLKNNLASSRGAPQENEAKFRFAIHPQGIQQFHDNCKIAKCQTVATLAPVYLKTQALQRALMEFRQQKTTNIIA